ncbi:unnamed protein product [Coregonus sp. 'balchen']|nr:unnamed protein product [Coregonus sp. 'balchen']
MQKKIVGYFERRFICDETRNPYFSKILKWFRYIDDILCVWIGTEQELHEFTSFFNSMNNDLKFSIEYDHKRVHFLDMWIKVANDELITPLYQKDNPPSALKRRLPKSQFYRVRPVCHSTEDFIDKAVIMRQRFLDRDYSTQCVEEAHQDMLNKSVQTSKEFSVTSITTFTLKAFMIKT